LRNVPIPAPGAPVRRDANAPVVDSFLRPLTCNVTSPWISSSSVKHTLKKGSEGCKVFMRLIQVVLTASLAMALSMSRYLAKSKSRFRRNSLYRSASFNEVLFFSISLLTWIIDASNAFTVSSRVILSAYLTLSLSFLNFLVLLSSMTNLINSNLSLSSSSFDNSSALALLACLFSKSVISS